MSVFTPVQADDLRTFLSRYAVGQLRGYQGIEEGIENTNFFVTTDAGEYVLTLFERTPAEDLPYFLGVMGHLADAGIPTAKPVADRGGEVLQQLNGRAATLVPRLRGRGVAVPNAAQCGQTGAVLARLHLAGSDFAMQRPNCRGPAWWTPAAQRLAPHLSADERALLDDEVAAQAAAGDLGLPGGVIHADLFRDNALFDGDTLTGLIDFYYACNDCWLYDLAVTANDWALNAGDEGRQERLDALLDGYRQVRVPTPQEQDHWSLKLRAAALRFWVSRLLDWHFPREGELTYRKDPDEFRALLIRHREQPLEL